MFEIVAYLAPESPAANGPSPMASVVSPPSAKSTTPACVGWAACSVALHAPNAPVKLAAASASAATVATTLRARVRGEATGPIPLTVPRQPTAPPARGDN